MVSTIASNGPTLVRIAAVMPVSTCLVAAMPAALPASRVSCTSVAARVEPNMSPLRKVLEKESVGMGGRGEGVEGSCEYE